MSSTSFAASHVSSLVDASKRAAITSGTDGAATPSPQAAKLYELLHQFHSPLDQNALRTTVKALTELEENTASIAGESSLNQEDADARAAVESRVLVGVYAEVLGRWLQEASEADAEAEWWASTARSQRSVLLYLIATLPARLQRTFSALVDALRAHHLPLRPSSFTPQTLRQLFPRGLRGRPTSLTTAFFPHLRGAARSALFASPLELVRQECAHRRAALVRLRDARAAELGVLALMRRDIARAVASGDVAGVAMRLQTIVNQGEPVNEVATEATAPRLGRLLFVQLPGHASAHAERLAALGRPSRLTLLWPRLALIPPIALLAFRVLYGSRETITNNALRARETVEGFWFGYVVQPLREILDTVRTGGEEGARLVSQEGVKADIESLERMSIALSKDKLSLSDVQLEDVTNKIRAGDLTPVLRIYEDDMKSPLRSAVAGTLVRSLLIQIQKAKVDLDQALSGIDKLLRSQELTFAFVGVAPALAILYGATTAARGVLAGGGHGDRRLGGRKEREGAWLAIRHVERLLLTGTPPESEGEGEGAGAGEADAPHQPHAHADADGDADADTTIPPLTTGLLLISLTRLRSYAAARLPSHSLLREGMLADVADLESPALGRGAKLRVVDRMWRSWGGVLGWERMGRL